MSIGGAGGVLVPSPACVPARFGLLSVAEIDDRAEGHWEAGISYDREASANIQIITPCPPSPETKVTDDGAVSTEDSVPFTLVAGYSCSVGGRPVEEGWDHAERRLSRNESRAVERAFWIGKDDAGNTIEPSLGQDSDVQDLTSGGAVTVTDGLALLEAFAADQCPCSPIIHAGRNVGVYLAERHLIERDGLTMVSSGTGSRVVIGAGYDGSGPEGDVPDDGEAWMFVSGSVRVVRGPTFYTPPRGDLAGAVDRAVNDVIVFAERTYALEKDCPTAAVRVTLASCCPS